MANDVATFVLLVLDYPNVYTVLGDMGNITHVWDWKFPYFSGE